LHAPPPAQQEKEKMAKVKINDKEFNMRFSLGFWDIMKTKFGITQENMEVKINEDFGNVMSNIIRYGVFYGVSISERPETVEGLPFDLEAIKDQLDVSVSDIIEETIYEGMTNAQKKAVDMIRAVRDKKITELGDDAPKKK